VQRNGGQDQQHRPAQHHDTGAVVSGMRTHVLVCGMPRHAFAQRRRGGVRGRDGDVGAHRVGRQGVHAQDAEDESEHEEWPGDARQR